jgi:hypothetical protein
MCPIWASNIENLAPPLQFRFFLHVILLCRPGTNYTVMFCLQSLASRSGGTVTCNSIRLVPCLACPTLLAEPVYTSMYRCFCDNISHPVPPVAAGRPATSPLTGLPLPNRELKPNNLVKSLVLEHLRAMQAEV